MEASNLQTAATYVNNLLLARGLLRNGKAVEFAQLASFVPKDTSSKRQAPAAPVVVADIINLVHDLILKRDRDAEHQESLANSLRTIKAEHTRAQSDVERLKTRNTELRRQVAISESAQRTAESTCKRAEATARTLREEVTKAKRIVDQVRASCATDIRKRDVQLSKLRTQLDQRSQQRGTNKGPGGFGGPMITIVPGKTGPGTLLDNNVPIRSVEDEQYSLKQETTEFLTQLSQSLSDENDQLIVLIRNTIASLRELQGLPHNQPNRIRGRSSGDPSTGTMSLNGGDELVHVNDVSFETLSRDLGTVLGSLSDLLTNPSFAPIEEVHLREEENARLREGWEKMESRWHEAMTMMQSWRERLINGGDTIRLDELKNGLRLGEGLDSPSPPVATLHEESQEGEVDEYEDVTEEEEEEGKSEEPSVGDLPAIDESLKPAAEGPLFDAPPAGSQGPIFPSDDAHEDDRPTSQQQEEPALRERNANAPPQQSPVHERLSNLHLSDTENSSPLPAKPRSKAAHSARWNISNTKTRANPKVELSKAARAIAKPATKANTRIPSRKAPVPKTRATQPKQSSPAPDRSLSVSEKLQLAEREARRMSSSPLILNGDSDTAPAPESPLEQKSSRNKQGAANAAGEEQAEHNVSVVGSLRRKEEVGKSPAKRTRISGRPRRRKSTLSPDELELLMMGR